MNLYSRSSDVSAGTRQRVFAWLAPVLLVVVVLFPFAQVGDFSFVNYDDPMHIGVQPAVLSGVNAKSVAWSLSATPSNLWHPVTWMSYMAEVSFFGGGVEAPSVHHLGNLLLHLICVLTVYAILRVLGIAPLLSMLVAMLYAVHPLHAEPVSWISARKDVLSGMFSLFSIWMYLLYQKRGAGGRGLLLLVLLALALALGSKPSSVVVPLLMVVAYGFLHRDENLPANPIPTFARETLSLWPCLLLAVVAAGMAVGLQHAGSHGQVIHEQSVFDRLVYLPALLGFYTWRIICPRGLTFDYPVPVGNALLGFYVLGVLLVLGCLLAWRWRRVLPGVALGGLWFLICLLPVMGFFYVGTSFSSDRYVYLALIGPGIALARLIESRECRQRVVLMGVLVVLIATCGFVTYKQVGVWKNDQTLFTHAVKHTPRSVVAQNNVASYYRTIGDERLAMHHYDKSLEIRPYDDTANYNVAGIHYKNGEWAKAREASLRALKSDPRYHRAHYLIGLICADASKLSTYDPDRAFKHFESAYQISPENPKYAYEYARQLASRQRRADALKVFEYGLGKLSPESPWFRRFQKGVQMLSR